MNIWSIIIGLFGLGILAAVHEIGHFLVAKWLGIKIEELSIFVGPSLIHWNRKGVDYHIRLIPFGAYVRFFGLETDDDGKLMPESYLNQPRWKRLLVSVAGPLTNVIFGILIFTVTFSIFGFYSTKLDNFNATDQIAKTIAQPGDRVEAINGEPIYTDLDMSFYLSQMMNDESVSLRLVSQSTGEAYDVSLVPEIKPKTLLGVSVLTKTETEIGWEVLSVDPEQNNGSPVIQLGDRIITVNGAPLFDEMYRNVMEENGDKTLTIVLLRDGVETEVQMEPIIRMVSNYRGIYTARGNDVGDLLKQAFLYPVSIIRVSVLALQDMFKGEVQVQDVLSGPVGMVMLVNSVVETPQVDNSIKVEQLLQMAGLISVGLAFSNMLPLPGLDGNALVLVTVEMIRGRKISEKTERIINVVGFVVLIALVILALTSDILRIKEGF